MPSENQRVFHSSHATQTLFSVVSKEMAIFAIQHSDRPHFLVNILQTLQMIGNDDELRDRVLHVVRQTIIDHLSLKVSV